MRSTLIRRIGASCLLVGSLVACTGTTASPGSTSTAVPESPATSPGTSPDSPSASGNAVTVTGVEYAYQGIPENAPAGTVVTFVNGGQEVHEIVAVRPNEGVTTTLEELLAMPPEESQKLVTFVGVAVASPGQTAPETITLDQPGNYFFVCFIPVGTTELPSLAPGESPNESLLPDGPPHFVQGMVAEFTVTE